MSSEPTPADTAEPADSTSAPASNVLPQQPRRTATATWIGLAFAGGALFALLPMYYLYAGSAASPRAAERVEPPSRAVETISAPVNAANMRFAARLTYELNQAPEEPAAGEDGNIAATSAAAESSGIALRPERARSAADRQPAKHIANARPISSTPPDPRDTTREMENEARRGDYRAQSGRAATRSQGAAVQPRVFEGREVVIPDKPAVTTRPIGMSSAARPADEADADARSRPQPLSQVTGISTELKQHGQKRALTP